MFVNIKNFFCLLLFLCVTAGLAASTQGQETKPPKPAPKASPGQEVKPPKTPPMPTKERHPMPGAELPGVFDNDGVTTERAMMVDPGVTIKLCVAQGELKVNGWRRNEVRVFVREGRRFGMKGLETSAESGKTNWLYIGRTPAGRLGPAAECLAGENIEIDAPIGASLDLSGREVRTTVDSLKKVKITVLAGAITLRNITGGIFATTNQGDVTVENSAGAIELGGTTGNIVIAEVMPGQIGDLLKAKTNSGAITMQRVEHRQIQANSISGSLFFDGKFLSGGIYNFRTSNGSIRLAIPLASSCTFKATYGMGAFKSDIPLEIVTETDTPRAKTVVATLGKGDAAVTLTTSTGSIGIGRNAYKP